jgi:hypothetical protein
MIPALEVDSAQALIAEHIDGLLYLPHRDCIFRFFKFFAAQTFAVDVHG